MAARGFCVVDSLFLVGLESPHGWTQVGKKGRWAIINAWRNIRDKRLGTACRHQLGYLFLVQGMWKSIPLL